MFQPSFRRSPWFLSEGNLSFINSYSATSTTKRIEYLRFYAHPTLFTVSTRNFMNGRTVAETRFVVGCCLCLFTRVVALIFAASVRSCPDPYILDWAAQQKST